MSRWLPAAVAMAGALAGADEAQAADPGAALPPVPLATLAADVRSCIGGTRDGASVAAALFKAGWSGGTVVGTGRGTLRTFDKDGILLLLQSDAPSSRSVCLEMARLNVPVMGHDILAALSGSFGRQPVQGPNGQQLWLLDGEVAGLRGNDPKAPTQVTVVVGPNGGNKEQ